MKPTPEQIAAFADGELDDYERMVVEAAIAADPALARQVAAHRALRERLDRHFSPVAGEPVPHRLTALLSEPPPGVIDLAAARRGRQGLSRWTWIAGPALAASLVLVITFAMRGEQQPGYADRQLASVLESQLAAGQPANAPVRILLSFRDAVGAYCRAFAGQADSGIACRDGTGWKLRAKAGATRRNQSEYRQAGSDAEIMQTAQDLATGPALGGDEERAARDTGWRPKPTVRGRSGW